MFFSILALSLIVLWGGVEQVQASNAPELSAQLQATPTVSDMMDVSPVVPSTWGKIKAMYFQEKQEGPQGSYPNYCFQLNVPFLVQLPPGTDWNKTNNCGQAVCVMLGGYYNNGAVASWVIDSENDWLGCPKPYGCGTGSGTLQSLLSGFHGLRSSVYYGRYADDVINEVANGRPTIVGCMISGGRLVSSGGRAHWALAVGWDGNVILHDPGTNSGRYIRYSVAAFEASWATQSKIYIPVYR